MSTDVVTLEKVGARLREERERLGKGQGAFGELGGVTRNSQQAYEAGRRAPDAAYLAQVADHGVDIGYVIAGARETTDVGTGPDLVPIEQIDLAYGMGASFTDGPINSEVMHFPRPWVEAITSSPPALLTWARGRGDSMVPTIHDGDIVLLDRSQRRVIEQDALWAYTVGDLGAIKRLRIKGDRVVILSDNPSVPADEEPIDEVNIVARVIFVGRRT